VKKTRIYLPLFVIVVTLGLSFDGIIPSSYSISYDEQVSDQKNNLWHLGKNLSDGDSFTYKICDPKAIPTSAANYHYFTQGNEDHNSSICYVIKLDFVNLLNSDENQINRDIWVVQAAISDFPANKDIRYSVFHIDAQTFEVRSADTIHPDTIRYADSLQKTLFSLFKYTAPEPQLLQTGTGWGEVTEALYQRGTNPHMTVLDNNQKYYVMQNSVRLIDNQSIPAALNITDAFKVGYDIDIFDSFIMSDDKKNVEDNNNVANYFLISSDLPFPLSATYYSPVHITQPQKQYEFELVFLTDNKDIDLGIKSVFEESKEIVITETPTNTGTIELTFPDNDDTVTADDVIEDAISLDDDHVVTDQSDDDVDDILADNPVQSDVIVDYSKIAGLVVLLVVMIAVFVVFKKFKESGFKTELKNTLKKKQQKHTIKEIVSFDDKLHIDIKTITNGN